MTQSGLGGTSASESRTATVTSTTGIPTSSADLPPSAPLPDCSPRGGRVREGGGKVGPGIPVSWLDQGLDLLSQVETPLDIGRPASAIYAYLADFTRHHEWAHTYITVEVLSRGPTRVGSRFRVIEKQDWRSDKLPYSTIVDREGVDYVSQVEVTALEPNQRIAWRSHVAQHPFSGSWKLMLRPVTESITTVRLRGRLSSPKGALEHLMKELQAQGYPLDVFARQVDRAMHNLRAILEGRAHPPAPL